MKIVHVIHCCSSGGAEVLAKNIIENIKNIENSFSIELWSIYRADILFDGDKKAIEFENNFVNELKDKGISVRFINKKNKALNRIKLISNIRKFYNDFKPQIIHCHLESVTFHIISSLMFRPVKVIETIHNIKINRINLHKYYLNRRICKFVAISKKVSSIIKKELQVSENNIELIYNGIDIERFKDKNIFSEKVYNIISVGRLSEQKDHFTLIKAFELLKQKCIESGIDVPQLNIVGDGNLKDELLRYIEEKGLDEIKLLGVVTNVEDLLKDHQIYVMSSIYEGLSLSLIEAMISRITTICTDVGSNDEIINNNVNGIVVKAKDYEELSNQLYRLIIDKEIRKNLYNDNEKLEKKFSIVECARSHIELYKSII